MPRTCTICNHPEREAIDKALIDNVAFRRIATLYGLSEASVRRHKGDHLPGELVKSEQAAEIAHADSLIDQVRDLQRQAKTIKDKAEIAGDLKTALVGIRELSRLIELMGKLQGELQEGATVNILVAPEWLVLRSVILKALDPHPEARKAVIKALENAH
jgi:hypothetical protein